MAHLLSADHWHDLRHFVLLTDLNIISMIYFSFCGWFGIARTLTRASCFLTLKLICVSF